MQKEKMMKAAVGEGEGEDGVLGTGESGSAGKEGDREDEGGKFQLFFHFTFIIYLILFLLTTLVYF